MIPATHNRPAARASIRPMLATLIDAPFDDADWLFETKWDGFRMVARVANGKAALYSRGGSNVTHDYPSIAAALAKVRHSAVLDGELVALDEKGRSRFQLLQNAQRFRARLRYCLFDLMFLDGTDLRKRPLIERKRLLRSILPKSSLLHFSRHVRRSGKDCFRKAQRAGLEGIIAKRADSLYRSGHRSRDWLKIKTAKRQEVVIAGFTRPRRSRKHFGSLVLVVRRSGAWHYAGHAGTGFSATALKEIHARLKHLICNRKPFKEQVSGEATTTWVRPRLVCEIKFTEWTERGQLRHPAFVGLRADKPAREVVRERPTRARQRPSTRHGP